MKRLYLTSFILNVTLCTCLFYFIPSLKADLQSEDRLIENLTALFFLTAALVSFFYLIKSKSKFLRHLSLIVTSLGLIAFLDEMSFGERAFDLSMPLIGSQKIDGLHDIVKLCFNLMLHVLKKLPLPFLILSLALLTGVIIAIAYKHKKRLYAITHTISYTEPYFFLRVTLLLLMTSTFIDFDLLQHETLFLLEELFEMNAALSLLFCSIYMIQTNKKAAISKGALTVDNREDTKEIIPLDMNVSVEE